MYSILMYVIDLDVCQYRMHQSERRGEAYVSAAWIVGDVTEIFSVPDAFVPPLPPEQLVLGSGTSIWVALLWCCQEADSGTLVLDGAWVCNPAPYWRRQTYYIAALIADLMWEDMSDAGQRIFCQLSSHGSLNVGRHEWRRPAHLLFAAALMVDSMWEDWGRDGQIINVRDMCGICPAVGRNATGLVKILITAKMWNSCGRTVLSFLYLLLWQPAPYTCSVLLRPGTFPLLHRHRACDLRAGAAFFVVHRLESSTNSPRFVQCSWKWHALMSLRGILAHCLFAALSSACAWQLIPSPHQRCNTVTCIHWMKRGTCICWTWLLRHLHRWSKILKFLASCSFRLLPMALWVWSLAIWWQAKSCLRMLGEWKPDQKKNVCQGVWYPFEI